MESSWKNALTATNAVLAVCITACIRYDGLIIDAAREGTYRHTVSRTIRDVHVMSYR